MGTVAVDRSELEDKVKQVYRAVAQNPVGKYHFKMDAVLRSNWRRPTACGKGGFPQVAFAHGYIEELPFDDASFDCNIDLWAACIGGATQEDTYQELIAGSGFALETLRTNPYEFLSDSARAATTKYGVRSLSILAYAG
ncbi:hypothetical protein ACQCSV_02000 [Pseudarthrobacter sp. S3]|uniref:hypothetical protein n=1 Tax=Pseudarthrobacter sp. S3 TaxID=3418419 RepID=UPI00339B7D7C